ncbi:hypothetical protein RSOLAG22IIIB_06913 [Rhizoctonia solani]|uniref:F-box domain-containing protein n=1 Tax=Rhizoctonia solani TaxID=456999 RepID=A0A0K6GHL8_9AGAM|nr:hypothetical protein RSOLAG22IIIB_06913 [Rhizoctonia solani]
MPKRTSAPPAKTRGKRVQKIVNDDAQDGVQRDTDLKNVSEKEDQQSLPQKRRRASVKSIKTSTSKKQAKGKQGRLAVIMNMPIDVLTEIASHLWPVDIINLARLNKSFRNILMTRPSIHIWHNAMKNVPILPDCPPDMSEPRYLALVFLKTCTSCGEAVNAEVDTVLRVRLCGPIISLSAVPPDIVSLIPYSRRIASVNAYVLREDVPVLLAEYEKKKQLNNAVAFQTWTVERKKIINARSIHADKLRKFFEYMEFVREEEIEAILAKRWEQMKFWLQELGWVTEDMDFSDPDCPNRREWYHLASQPKVLSKREWKNLKPKLIPLLEANRARRLELEFLTRQSGRQFRLMKLLYAIKEKDSFTIKIPAQHPAISLLGLSSISVSYEPAFPEISYALKWPVIFDLYETDRTTAEMEVEFEQHRGEIERFISEWQTRIQTHCSRLALQGPKVTKILQSSLTIGTDKSEPFAEFSDDLKRLLRADSFFSSTTSQLDAKQPLSYDYLLHFDGLLGLPTAVKRPKELTLDGISWNSEANKAARELLACLEIPDAPYLDMTNESIYACGRCHDTEAKGWHGIVNHYVNEKQRYAEMQKEGMLSRQGIVYKNVHDPKQCTELPLVRYSDVQVRNKSDLYECKVCADAPVLGEVLTSKEALMQHLSAVHDITNPVINEHYAPQINKKLGQSKSGR